MWLIDWIKTNSDAIVTFLTSANFIALVTMIVKTIFGAKQTKLLKDNLNNLETNLSDVAKAKDDVVSNTGAVNGLLNRIENLELQLNANNKAMEAMLSIMSVVYMRSKDEDVRSSVASILSTFKNGDVTVRNLKLEIEHLREQLKNALDAMTKDEEVVDDTVEQNSADEAEKIVLRG